MERISQKKLAKIPLSNNTVKRHIATISEDVRDQLFARLHGNNFALQIDESTDVSKMAQFLAYVRYEWENEIKEDFFCFVKNSVPRRRQTIFLKLWIIS